MKRSLWLIFGALLLLAAVALFRAGTTEDMVAAAEAPAAPLPDVHVRHEFVTVPAPAARSHPAVGIRSGPPPVRTAAARPSAAPDVAVPVRRAGRDAGFLERARRAVVGDGRFRPQPFPRPKDQ